MIASLPLLWMAEPLSGSAQTTPAQNNDTLPNVLILIFDTLCAQHTTIDGYQRRTTPNLERFAQRANVYHRHYSAGSFTNPGTASLLTGVYPWTHRALRFRSFVHKSWRNKSVFNLLGDDYYSVAFSHNTVAASFLYQFLADLDNLIPTRDLCLLSGQIADKLFVNDYQLAIWRERLMRGGGPILARPTSPAWYRLSTKQWEKTRNALYEQYQDEYPRGLPHLHDNVYRMKEVIDWLTNNLGLLPQPNISYFHFLPPHDPYNPSREFIGMFDNGWPGIDKTEHHFTAGYSHKHLRSDAKKYDEFIAYADDEFGRLYDHLVESGLLDNTIVMITSDHGEMFERGIWGHSTETLYDAVVRVPLLISNPGQTQRVDIHTPTSAVDVVPTILHETGHPIPAWCEGDILPGFDDGETNNHRSVYTLDAKGNSVNTALRRASFALVKDNYKLVRYIGYPGFDDQYELYNMVDDPDELTNIYPANPSIAGDLRAELLTKVDEVNSPYT